MAITGTPTESADTLLGTSGPDTIDGLGGNDEILGLAGADSLIGGTGDDSVDGGTENDTLEGGLGGDTLSGGDGDDTITDTGGGSNFLYGGLGSDSLQVSSGQGGLYGGDDNDTLTATGTSYADLRGEDGSDSLQISSGAGLLYGGDDNDTLTATGTDYATLYGQGGADSLLGGNGKDILDGGSGLDTITGAGGSDAFSGYTTELNGDRITDYTADDKILLYQDLASAAQVQLVAAANGADTELRIDGDNNGSFETVLTLSGTVTGNIILTSEGYTNNVIRIAPADTGNEPDSVVGSAQDDIISTLGGNDTIVAGEGNDTVNGGADDDLVNGGAGDDSIDGGDGTADTVLLAGPWSDYTITESGSVYTIVDGDLSNGDEGTDTVSNVERIAFNGSAATTFAIADALNDTPVLDNAIADQTATQDTAFSLTVDPGTFSDADAPLGDSLTLAATLADGTPLPGWLRFDATTASFSGTPTNADAGTLSVEVTATDNAGASVSDSFDIAVGNINDAPTITSNGGNATAAVSILENTTDVVTTVVATDPDAGQTPSYALAGGADAAKFSINANTGALIFRAAPDYEKPRDAGRNNVYDVTVQVSDGSGGTDTQALAVTVTNVNDKGKPSSGPGTATEGNDTLTGTKNADTLNGLGGNDSISGLGRNDTLSGGAGSDRLTGGAGADSLTGGTEADTFIFAAASDSRLSAFDTIADFSPVDDTIDIRRLRLADGSNDVFDKGAITPLSGNSTNFFRSDGAQYDVVYGRSGSDTFVYVDANGDGSFKTNQDMVIKLANFTGALTDSDFLLA